MISESTTIQVAQIVPCTEAEGPGKRFALWFQGCPLRCPGCCNPEFLPFHGGESVLLAEVLRSIEKAGAECGIEGVTLLGGEPFAHADGASALAEAVQERGWSVMVFTGYTLEELRGKNDLHCDCLLAHTDILVDGPYLREAPDRERRWIGSTNQRIHFLTGRYDPADPCWKQRNTLEIRLDAGILSVNGFPAAAAKDFWKGKFQRIRGE